MDNNFHTETLYPTVMLFFFSYQFLFCFKIKIMLASDPREEESNVNELYEIKIFGLCSILENEFSTIESKKESVLNSVDDNDGGLDYKYNAFEEMLQLCESVCEQYLMCLTQFRRFDKKLQSMQERISDEVNNKYLQQKKTFLDNHQSAISEYFEKTE
ncbi:hypothetical protein EDEG_03335 [Edhazardia aedis USNM 41457]|uniref:Uncharacterized protein n=1 Tax=Edhazardia aedis (strain USNM 41457) TaxID=1003232 RepID=J9DLI0_EDHAE|nr:hypothetical protein EDEG_03335 [Edhazardia aedis USNM 41457]|eukprot:EJW02217.1 hypothetical protein EDEG_03335 [Edhazardia aedis USNM 41457]